MLYLLPHGLLELEWFHFLKWFQQTLPCLAFYLLVLILMSHLLHSHGLRRLTLFHPQGRLNLFSLIEYPLPLPPKHPPLPSRPLSFVSSPFLCRCPFSLLLS